MERDFIDKPKRHVNQTMWELDSNPDSTNSIKKKKMLIMGHVEICILNEYLS